jgi:hypothetical protein
MVSRVAFIVDALAVQKLDQRWPFLKVATTFQEAATGSAARFTPHRLPTKATPRSLIQINSRHHRQAKKKARPEGPPVRNSAECRDMAAQFAKLADEASSSSNERVLLLHLSSSWAVLAWVTEFLEQQDASSTSSFRSGRARD